MGNGGCDLPRYRPGQYGCFGEPDRAPTRSANHLRRPAALRRSASRFVDHWARPAPRRSLLRPAVPVARRRRRSSTTCRWAGSVRSMTSPMRRYGWPRTRRAISVGRPLPSTAAGSLLRSGAGSAPAPDPGKRLCAPCRREDAFVPAGMMIRASGTSPPFRLPNPAPAIVSARMLL